MVSGSVGLTGVIALIFALVHVFGRSMRFLQVTPRSVWLSLSGGVSLAYVFVHLLPELAAKQEEALEQLGEPGGAMTVHVYVTALAGLIAIYGLDRLVRQLKRRNAASEPTPIAVFWLHLCSYAVYNTLVGYLLVHREEADLQELLIYAVAMALHFIVNDQGLREYHGRIYDHTGRRVVAAAPLAGWGLGLVLSTSPLAVSTLFAFLAGGIILNVLKEELPDDRESRFWALAVGALAFSLLLLTAR